MSSTHTRGREGRTLQWGYSLASGARAPSVREALKTPRSAKSSGAHHVRVCCQCGRAPCESASTRKQSTWQMEPTCHAWRRGTTRTSLKAALEPGGTPAAKRCTCAASVGALSAGAQRSGASKGHQGAPTSYTTTPLPHVLARSRIRPLFSGGQAGPPEKSTSFLGFRGPREPNLGSSHGFWE